MAELRTSVCSHLNIGSPAHSSVGFPELSCRVNSAASVGCFCCCCCLFVCLFVLGGILFLVSLDKKIRFS